MEVVLNHFIKKQLDGALSVIDSVRNDAALMSVIGLVAEACVACLRSGGKIMLAGNGGSAADAQHIAGELVSRFMFDRPGLAAVALTTDSSVLTAIGNDYGYEMVFERQMRSIGRPGDVLFGYSTSGQSRNIINAMRSAQEMGIRTIGMTGDRRGPIVGFCDYVIAVPSPETPRIQEAHLAIGHAICGMIEKSIFQ